MLDGNRIHFEKFKNRENHEIFNYPSTGLDSITGTKAAVYWRCRAPCWLTGTMKTFAVSPER
jgi:hypothetical protein